MPSFFRGAAGRAVGCADPQTLGTIRLTNVVDSPILWRTHQSIITRLTLSTQGNFQFLHTIGNDIYIYVFGDRVGQVTLSGLSLAGCEGAYGHGIEQILRWYGENRVARRKSPVIVSIGAATAIEGFVTGLTADTLDAQTRIMQYSLQLAVLPEKR